jgi:hypothetical protein
VLAQYPLSSFAPAKQANPAVQPKVAAKPSQANSEIRSLAEARAKGLNLRDILKLVETEQQATDADNPLTQDEANTLSDMDVLSSNRVGQRRATWRPEHVFDTL